MLPCLNRKISLLQNIPGRIFIYNCKGISLKFIVDTPDGTALFKNHLYNFFLNSGSCLLFVLPIDTPPLSLDYCITYFCVGVTILVYHLILFLRGAISTLLIILSFRISLFSQKILLPATYTLYFTLSMDVIHHSKELIPIRPNRSRPRDAVSACVVSFNYRLA